MSATSEPVLLTLHGRIDGQVLADAISAVRQGAYREWRLVQDQRRKVKAGPLHLLASLATLVVGQFNLPGSGEVRRVVLEDRSHKQRVTLDFRYLGEANGRPLWDRS